MTYQVTRKQVVDAALEYRGVRFLHQGRYREHGVDCMGLFEGVLRAVKYPKIIDVEAYRPSPPATLIYDTLCRNFDQIELSDVHPGDLYLMRIGGGMKVKHGAILISDQFDPVKGLQPEIIHAHGLAGKGSVVVEPLSQWISKCVFGFRLRGLVD